MTAPISKSNNDIFKEAIKNKISSGGKISGGKIPISHTDDFYKYAINNEEIKKNYNSDFRLRGGEIPYSHNYSPIRQNINLFKQNDNFPDRNKILEINKRILYNKKN